MQQQSNSKSVASKSENPLCIFWQTMSRRTKELMSLFWQKGNLAFNTFPCKYVFATAATIYAFYQGALYELNLNKLFLEVGFQKPISI